MTDYYNLLDVSKKVSKFENVKFNPDHNQLILTTIHRRENWGKRLRHILKALDIILKEFENVIFLIPLHKNKIVRDPIIEFFRNERRVILVEPLNYEEMVGVIKESKFLLN